jgi:predicted signal transduction protein with EAL and GGDEF domain
VPFLDAADQTRDGPTGRCSWIASITYCSARLATPQSDVPSLTALHHYPVDALKIDRSFVASMDQNSAGTDVIVSSTVALAHNLGLSVVAEGIEDDIQLQRLRTFGCEYGQGFLFSKPLSHENTEVLLKDWSPTWATTSAHDFHAA